jgi:hypothetical protein
MSSVPRFRSSRTMGAKKLDENVITFAPEECAGCYRSDVPLKLRPGYRLMCDPCAEKAERMEERWAAERLARASAKRVRPLAAA